MSAGSSRSGAGVRWTSRLPEYQEVKSFLSTNFAEGSSFIGFYPPKGWLGLVKNIHMHILESEPDYVIYQIKEKFGGLRYYANLKSEANIEFVKRQEMVSLTICQNCGQVGSLRTSPVAVMCDDCCADNATGYFY